MTDRDSFRETLHRVRGWMGVTETPEAAPQTPPQTREGPPSWRYLRPADLKRLRNMEFVARKVVEGYFSGKHRSATRDFAQEFADYRGYVPGDDPRMVDWKAYARTDRFYVRLFRKDTGMACFLLLDTSNSMAYGVGHADLSKLEYACYLVAALGFLIVKQGDRAGLCLFDSDVRSYLPPASTLPHLSGILNELEHLQPAGVTRISAALRHAFHLIKRRGLIIVVSDFLDEPNDIFAALSMFTHSRSEVVLFHVLHDHELELPDLDHARFVDLETRGSLVTEPAVLRPAYRQEFGRYLGRMRAHARARRIDYNLVPTSTHYNELIEKYLWVRHATARVR